MLLMSYPMHIFLLYFTWTTSCCCYSVAQSCLALCNPMDCSMPGLPVPYRLLEFAQVHVQIAVVMPSSHLILWCPLLLPTVFPSVRDFPVSNHSHQMAKILGLQHQSFLVNIQGWYPLRLTSLISLLFKGLSGVFSNTAEWTHQLFGVLPCLWSSSYNCTWPVARL